jgi:diguanylate cyclase (GGDEF)-like protein
MLVPAAAPVNRSRTGTTRRRIRSWHAKAAAFRAAVLVFLLAAAVMGVVVYTLDRNAQRSNMQQVVTELSSGSRVAASTFSTLRANQRAHAGQVATSLDLQRAVISGNQAELRQIASAEHARVVVGKHVFGSLAPAPRVAATALIASGGHVLARVTVTLPLGDSLLSLIRDETPLPPQAALVLAQDGHVIAGGPKGAPAAVTRNRVTFGKISFAAESARAELPHTRILAVEPMRAVEAAAAPYRRRLLLAALVTLILAAGVATRLGRPVARLLSDVSRLTRQAQTDALTGLANRRSLDERLLDELGRAATHGTCFTFVLADIDDFKLVNDTHGHQIGDEVLRAVARAFGDSVRELDLAARFGGEEFALVLPNTRVAGAQRIVERIRKAIGELEVKAPDGIPVTVTASFGLAAYPTFTTVDAIVEAADRGLYEAKRAGKDRVVAETGPQAPKPAPVRDVPAPA